MDSRLVHFLHEGNMYLKTLKDSNPSLPAVPASPQVSTCMKPLTRACVHTYLLVICSWPLGRGTSNEESLKYYFRMALCYPRRRDSRRKVTAVPAGQRRISFLERHRRLSSWYLNRLPMTIAHKEAVLGPGHAGNRGKPRGSHGAVPGSTGRLLIFR